MSKDYTKNGKWSHYTWDVELMGGALSAPFAQDFETGRWINSLRWPEAIKEFGEKFAAGMAVDRNQPHEELAIEAAHRRQRIAAADGAIVRFIRATWPKTAEELDKTDAASVKADSSQAIKDLAAAQQELAAVQAEVSKMEADAQATSEAESIRKRVAAARMAMASGASLYDLRALLM